MGEVGWGTFLESSALQVGLGAVCSQLLRWTWVEAVAILETPVPGV